MKAGQHLPPTGRAMTDYEQLQVVKGYACWMAEYTNKEGKVRVFAMSFKSDAEEHIRRIVACVNACKGILTELLEEHSDDWWEAVWRQGVNDGAGLQRGVDDFAAGRTITLDQLAERMGHDPH